MKKVILFDFWGTLVENGIWSPTKQVKNLLKVNLPFTEYVVRMERSMMTKKFVGLKDAFKHVCKEFKIEPNEDLIDELVGLWNKNWMLAKPYEETIDSLKELKQNHKLILIANTNCFSIPKVLEKFQMENLFDIKKFSYECNLIKTDPEFLKKIIKNLNVAVEDCLLVGDSIQSDIMAAKKVGMSSILIDRKNTRDFIPKIKDLKALGPFLK